MYKEMQSIPVAVLPRIPSFPIARGEEHQLLLGTFHTFQPASSQKKLRTQHKKFDEYVPASSREKLKIQNQNCTKCMCKAPLNKNICINSHSNHHGAEKLLMQFLKHQLGSWGQSWCHHQQDHHYCADPSIYDKRMTE